MSLQWDQVQTEFAGEETTNFGPRKETGTALYQVDTIATISPKHQGAGRVHNLVSAALGEQVTIGIDRHLTVFRDSQHVTTIAFENLVEDCAWSPDGSLLLVVDSGGKLHLFDAQSLKPIFSHTLVANTNVHGKAFYTIVFRTDTADTERCDLVVLSSMGLLFVVKSFSPSAFVHGGGSLADVIEAQLQFRKVQTRDAHTVLTLDAIPLGGGGVITVGAGDSVIAVWTWQDDDITLDDCVSDTLDTESPIVCAKLASNDKVLYCLDQLNQISVWVLPELIKLSCMTTLSDAGAEMTVGDFLLLETKGPQTTSVAGSCLVLLAEEEEEESSTLQIRSMDSGQDVYTLQQLGSLTTLAKCSTTQESLYLAEGTSVSGDPSQVSTVRLRCLTETDPETRLQRILHRKRFDEALQFAQLFHLDKERVYKAQMNQLLDQLSPWNVLCFDDHQVAAMVEQLWTSIDNIKDSLLVAENCMRAALPSFQGTWRLLKLCYSKLQADAKIESERHQSLQTKVLDLQNRLMTYDLAYGSDSYSAESWMRFQQANLLHVVCREMTHQKPHVAVLVWRRHCEEWRGQMSNEIVHQFLKAVAERLPADSVLNWLTNDLLPYIATCLPKALGGVIQWAVQRADRMEMEEKRGWPQNAIRFLEALSQTVTDLTEVNFTAVEVASKTQIEVHGVLSPLRSMLKVLHQLQGLLQYNLHLSVKQFMQETKESVAYRMLDQVVMVDLIRSTLEKYITPYIRHHGLEQDHILATYIKDLLERLGDVRSYTGQSAWEEKVLAIVSFIHSPKEKCCAVLNVIKHAPLPWSPDIQNLVQEGFKIQHPLVKELKEAKKIADIRLLMRDYGLRTDSVPSQDKAQRLAICLVEKDRPTSLADALRVLKEYNVSNPRSVSEVYFRHANALIRSDRVSQYLQVLHSLESTQAHTLGWRVVSLAEISLAETDIPLPLLQKLMDDHKQPMTLAAVLSLQYLIPTTTDPVDVEELKLQLKTLSSLLSLQREYSLLLSVKQYSDAEERKRIFAEFTQKRMTERSPFQRSGDMAVLYRLADLLQLQRPTVQGELATREARAGHWDNALFLCRELLEAEASPRVAEVLHRVVRSLLHLQGQGGNDDDDDNYDDGGDDDDDSGRSASPEQRQQLAIVLEKLANQATVMCDATTLSSCLELSKSVRLWRNVAAQCEATDTASTLDPEGLNWLDAIYCDEAVMTSAVTLPLAARSLSATVSFVNGTPAPRKDEKEEEEEDNEVCSVATPLSGLQPALSHLRENNHLQLCLRFLVCTAASLREALTKHDMGFPLSPQVSQWLAGQKAALEQMEKRAAPLFNSLIASLTLKVLSARRVDGQMALCCLLSAPRKMAADCLMKSIAAANFNFRKLGVIAGVGVALGHLCGEAKVVNTCQELQTNSTWGQHLAKIKISFKEAFQGGLSSKHNVICSMAQCEQVDVSTVADFALDFKMDVADGLLVYLEQLLKSQPRPWQIGRARGVVTAVLARDRKGCLLNKLKDVYKQTSPYDYDVIEFLFGEISKLNDLPEYDRNLKLVSYLKMYSRHSPPTEKELTSIGIDQTAREECGDLGNLLPEGAKDRVPFHPLLVEDMAWSVITPELDAENVPQWLQIAQLLKLSTDDVYLIAAQNIIKRHLSHSASGPSEGGDAVRGKSRAVSAGSWQVSEAGLQVLEQVQHLLNCVKSCSLALAGANWVIRELPKGGERVLALQGSVEFARRWRDKSEEGSMDKEKAVTVMSKFQRVLCKVLTEQALYVSSLAEPPLLQLVASPDQLIARLTEHEAVVDEMAKSGPDVFATLEKVCQVNDLDLGQVLVTALTRWLLASDSSQDDETTMNLSFSNLKMTEDALETSHNDNIKRVLYFLHRAPKPQMVKFLINTVQSGSADGSSHVGRMNCLYCLLQIADDADLYPMGLTCCDVREMLHVSVYLTQLEELHIQHSAQTFQDCNKAQLVRAIWRNHKHQKTAVKLATALCLDYGLFDRQQWAALLQQTVTLNMLSELEPVLQRLQSVPALWSLPVFTAAWQALLTHPLRSASLPMSEEQIKACLHAFNLLQSCPVCWQLDLSALKQLFQSLDLDVCAVSCLIMDPSVPQQDIQDMLSQAPTKLIEQTYTLTVQGMNLPAATQVREVLFQVVLERGDYHLISQGALPDFVRFIIAQDDIDGCLMFALTNDRFSQAEQLVTLYFQRYPEQYDELVAWCKNSSFKMDSVLEAHLHMKNLV